MQTIPNPNEQPANRNNMDTPVKRAYARPELKIFGKVQELTKGTTGTQSDGSQQQMGGPCDRALKENIVKIGDHPLGIGLYLFDYKPEYRKKWGHGRQFGVMAQEVETVVPEAVSVHPDGHKQVDYALLGISRHIH